MKAVSEKDSKDLMSNALAAFGITKETTVAPSKSSKKTKDREAVELGQDLDYLAALQLVAKTLEDSAKVIDAELKLKVAEMFGQRMFRDRCRPEALIGTGPRSSAYLQLSKRGSNSALDEHTIGKLDELGVHYEKQEKIPARLVINPSVLENPELVAAIAEAVQTHPKLQGVQVVQPQAAVFHYSTSDETLPQLARAVKTEDEAIAMLQSVARVSIGKFQIDKLKDPTQLIERALEIITSAKLLTGEAA